MIKMDTKQEILRRYFRENDSERKIARDLQLNRKTVKRYLKDYLKAQEESDVKGAQDSFQDQSCSPPEYDSSTRSKRKLTEEVAMVIQGQLKANEIKKHEGLRKQMKRKVDIHEYLLSQGIQIGYTTVCNYIREREIAAREAFIRQAYLAGEECEFDWGEVKLKINGKQCRFYMAVFTSSYSNYRFAKLYLRQDTLAFMESHNNFFGHVGGVFHEMVYDNMRVAIAEFVGRTEKNPTRALTNLSGWFMFRWRFCNVRRGNEKGHVERSVEYIRRKAFCHLDEFDDLAQAQQHLSETVERLNNLPAEQTGVTPSELLAEEKKQLWKFPGEMECYLTSSLKIDKYSTFSYGTNRYSVPDYLVGKMVDVKVYANRLKVYHNQLHLFTHQRNYGTYQWVFELEHYLKTLSRKPGALHGSVALEQSPPEIKNIYQRFFTDQPKSFIEILLFCKENGINHENLVKTVHKVNSLCPGDVSADKVMALLGNQPNDLVVVPFKKDRDEIEDHSVQQLLEITLLTEQGLNKS